MTTFTLDTSGAVPMPSAHGGTIGFRWGGLNAFTQGYIEAMFASMARQDGSPILHDPPTGKIGSGLAHYVGFDNLAPGTLERIIEDCATLVKREHSSNFAETLRHNGRIVWGHRAKGLLVDFPPLTPHLGDDGKVHLRNATAEPRNAAVETL